MAWTRKESHTGRQAAATRCASRVARSPHSAVFPGIARTRFSCCCCCCTRCPTLNTLHTPDTHTHTNTHSHSIRFVAVDTLDSTRHAATAHDDFDYISDYDYDYTSARSPLLIPQVVGTLVAPCNMLPMLRDSHVASCPTYQHLVSWQTSLLLLLFSIFLLCFFY